MFCLSTHINHDHVHEHVTSRVCVCLLCYTPTYSNKVTGSHSLLMKAGDFQTYTDVTKLRKYRIQNDLVTTGVKTVEHTSSVAKNTHCFFIDLYHHHLYTQW